MLYLINIIIFISLIYIPIAQNISSNDSVTGKKIENIIFIGDTQKTSGWEFWREKNDSVSRLLMQKTASEDPLCFIHLGDMVFKGSSSGAWEKFDSDIKCVTEKNIPIYPILGNHEYFGNNKAAFEQIKSRFPILMERTWYSVKIKSIGIILLNSNFNELSKQQNREQIEWYNNELEKFQLDSTINCIIVTSHHPPYTNSKVVKDSKEVQSYFVKPFFAVKKPGLFFSGHCHSYEHFINEGKHFIVSGGGGGPRQKLNTKTVDKIHDDQFIGPQLRDFNYCKLSFIEKGLLFETIMFDKNGTFRTGESFIIEK